MILERMRQASSCQLLDFVYTQSLGKNRLGLQFMPHLASEIAFRLLRLSIPEHLQILTAENSINW